MTNGDGVGKRKDPVGYIVGPHRIQNELIGSLLRDHLNVKCVQKEKIPDLLSELSTPSNRPRIVLCDHDGLGSAAIFSLIRTDAHGLRRNYVVVFNVPPGSGVEEEYISKGVRGIFYDKDSVNELSKGLSAVLREELWFSRKLMTKYILKGYRSWTGRQEANLTGREKEILAFVATGSRNDEIAEQLCLNTHTVKTHLNNIYKKIGVSNRLQASLWAAKHL